MPSFRKKPVVVEAFRYREDGPTPVPEWFGPDAYWFDMDGRMRINDRGSIVHPGDWIVRDHHGTIRTCSNEEFEATYDPADA